MILARGGVFTPVQCCIVVDMQTTSLPQTTCPCLALGEAVTECGRPAVGYAFSKAAGYLRCALGHVWHPEARA